MCSFTASRRIILSCGTGAIGGHIIFLFSYNKNHQIIRLIITLLLTTIIGTLMVGLYAEFIKGMVIVL